jgi:hypothetical protein
VKHCLPRDTVCQETVDLTHCPSLKVLLTDGGKLPVHLDVMWFSMVCLAFLFQSAGKKLLVLAW